MSEWMPIDKAPKDGTVVDLWLHDGDISCGSRLVDCFFSKKENNWMCIGNGSEERADAYFEIISHFMALPEPPK